MATLLSVNVGMPEDVAWRGRTVHTGVWKSPVRGPRMVRRLNIDGDGQGDLAGHGGEQRAVLVYQIESYQHWQEFFGRDDLGYGAFGENFTVEGLGDEEVCIGDRYRIGEAEFEVTQPRVTCFRVAMRMGEPQLPSLLVAHHRPGFYLRVLTEGYVAAGEEIVRTRRDSYAWSVADIDALLYLPGHDREKLTAAQHIAALSPGWRESFRSMLNDDVERRPAGVAVAPPPAWTGFRTLTVTDVVVESASVTSFGFAGGGLAGLCLAKQLRDDKTLGFEQLVDLCGVDYSSYKDMPWDGPRFCVVTHLLSLANNWRVRLKVFATDDDLPVVPALTPTWNAANWFEREAFDMYGIIFEGHDDLRRILTDYGFIGHPMRKDFPVTGHVEMRYDAEQRRVVYQPVTIEPREITPRVIREDNYGGLH